MNVTGLLPSYIAAFDPLAGTPPVYQIIDGMTFTDWSCYRYVSLSSLHDRTKQHAWLELSRRSDVD